MRTRRDEVEDVYDGGPRENYLRGLSWRLVSEACLKVGIFRGKLDETEK